MIFQIQSRISFVGLEMHTKALKHHQFVMVDPVDQFIFYVSRLCFEFVIHSGNLAGVATW